MAAIELATLVLPAADTAANHRESFIDVLALDPGLVGRGQGRRAARILSAVLVALRQPDRTLSVAAGRGITGDQRDEGYGETGTGNERGAKGRELRHDADEV
jgi:hypothetical protein